jgi:hypothetical protein
MAAINYGLHKENGRQSEISPAIKAEFFFSARIPGHLCSSQNIGIAMQIAASINLET